MMLKVFWWVVLAVPTVGVSLLHAADDGSEASWPEFHGPRRDNISAEKGLLKEWPKEGPRLLWKYSQCGRGYSGVAIANGKIFTAGDFDDDEMLITLDLDGRLLWRSPNGKSWTGPTPGSRTTPTLNDGVVYHLNPTGRLAAYRAESGKPIWSVDLQSEFDARYGVWAMSENVVIDGHMVICLAGGSRGLIVALDKHTGKTIWASTEWLDHAAYCSPVVATYKGVRQLITMTRSSVISVDVRNGKFLWSYPFGRRVAQNTTTPVFHDGYVFATSGHSTGGTLLKINPDLHGVTRVWHRRDLDNCHGGVVLIDGRLYGCGCRLGGKAFFCVDFLTGETKHTDKTVGKVSIAYADGMLYCLHHKGKMLLIEITPDGFRVVSRFDMPKESKDLYLCHPVVCGGRLYLRHDQNLYVYDIAAK